jgi:hypothetical protein
VQARTWNSERPLVFVAVVLQTTPRVRQAGDIRKRITHRMDLWYQGAFTALVDDTEMEVQSRLGSHPVADEETWARAYNAKVLSGHIPSAVRTLTSRDQGGVLQPPDDDCTKTGRPVLEVLRRKHPAMRDPAPDLSDPDRGSFEPYIALPEPVPVEITGDVVRRLSPLGSRLARRHGCRGPEELAPALRRGVRAPQRCAGWHHRMARQRISTMGRLLRAHGMPAGRPGQEPGREASRHR